MITVVCKIVHAHYFFFFLKIHDFLSGFEMSVPPVAEQFLSWHMDL